MVQTVKRPFYWNPKVTYPFAAIMFVAGYCRRNYPGYKFAKKTVDQRERYIEKVKGKPTMPQQKQEEIIKKAEASRDYWAAKLEVYDRNGASKLFNLYDKMMK